MEDALGHYTMASKLKYIPPHFTNNVGEPFNFLPQTACLSKHYSPSGALNPGLERIGIKTLAMDDFVTSLHSFMVIRTHEFQNMPDHWHTLLCVALSRLLRLDMRVKYSIMSLNIVPLRDGRWVSMSQKIVCFPSRSETLILPKGIEVLEIHPRVVEQHQRCTLFSTLGATAFSEKFVCDAIVRIHTSREPLTDLAISELIGHASFLYTAGWKNAQGHELWCISEDGHALPGSQTYIDSEEPYSATAMFAGQKSQFPFLHHDYFKGHKMGSDIKNWLVNNLLVAEYPRIATTSGSLSVKISTEFEYLLSARSSLDIMLLLRDQWKHYSIFLGTPLGSTKDSTLSEPNQRLRSLVVDCHGGKRAPLSRTILPLTNIVAEDLPSMSFVDIPDPDDPRWGFLSHFDVVVQSGPDPFIRNLRQQKVSNPSVEEISNSYTHLQDYWPRHSLKMRYARAELFSQMYMS